MNSNNGDFDFGNPYKGISLPFGTTREELHRKIQESYKDIAHLNREYNRFIGNKQSNYMLMSDDIYGAIRDKVHFNGDYIDIKELSKLVMRPDHDLYKAVVKIVYGLFHEKPKTSQALGEFKRLLLYYLLKAGF